MSKSSDKKPTFELACSSDDVGPQGRPSFLRKLGDEIVVQLHTTGPTLFNMIILRLPWLISLRFVGAIGAKELAAAALATTMFTVTGLSAAVGLSSAITTLTGQARGDLLSKIANTEQRGLKFDKNNELVEEGRALLKDISDASRYYSTIGGRADFEGRDAAQDRREPFLPLVYLYRGIAVQLLFVLPIGMWWLSGIESFLVRLGQDKELAFLAANYLKILVPGLWFYSVNWSVTAWLQAIDLAFVPAYVASVGLVLHIPFNYLFVYIFDWGYLGCAAATAMFQLLQPIMTLMYMFAFPTGSCRILEKTGASAVGKTSLSFWKEAKKAMALAGIGQYLGLGIPGLVAVSEWWASEFTIFLSGQLSPDPASALAGMSLYNAINAFVFMIPLSFSVTAGMRVGNLLGAGQARNAKFAASVSVVGALLACSVVAAVLLAVPHTFFPGLFAPDETEVVLQTSKIVSLLAIYIIADGMQIVVNGVLKGCGRQCAAVPIVVFSYWVLAVPLSYYLAFQQFDGIMCEDHYLCGDVGLVFGLFTGTCSHALLLGMVLLRGIDWQKEAKKAKERLACDSHTDEGVY